MKSITLTQGEIEVAIRALGIARYMGVGPNVALNMRDLQDRLKKLEQSK